MSMAVGLIVHADQAEAILQEGRADLIALAREILYNPNWPMDAAQKLGVDKDFASVPPPQSYWLAKRASSVKDLVPSTYQQGIDGKPVRRSPMPRFAPVTPEQWTAGQQKVADAIIAGPRGAVGGPFPTWLRCPELASRLQELGEYIRFKRALPVNFVSIAILVTARHWQCQYEWDHHSKTAAKAGISQRAIARILANESAGRPVDGRDGRLRLLPRAAPRPQRQRCRNSMPRRRRSARKASSS